MNTDEIKRTVCRRAVDECVRDGMLIGIGTGSTVSFAIEYLAEKIKQEELKSIRLVPTSTESELLCLEKHLPVISKWETFLGSSLLDLSLDGADKVTESGDIVKGMGGAAVREKIIAYNSYRFVVLVDETKLVEKIMGFIPLEVLPFAYRFVQRKLAEFSIELHRRKAIRGKDGILLSDNGNLIMDAYLSMPLSDPEGMEKTINSIPGVVDNGIFCHTNQSVYVGYLNGEVKRIDFESLSDL